MTDQETILKQAARIAKLTKALQQIADDAIPATENLSRADIYQIAIQALQSKRETRVFKKSETCQHEGLDAYAAIFNIAPFTLNDDLMAQVIAPTLSVARAKYCELKNIDPREQVNFYQGYDAYISKTGIPGDFSIVLFVTSGYSNDEFFEYVAKRLGDALDRFLSK